MQRTSLILVALLAACGGSAQPEPPPAPEEGAAPAGSGVDPAALRAQAATLFGALPPEVGSEDNPLTPEKVALGKALYFDPRLSMASNLSCNSCHDLERFGVDREPTSPGHEGQRGTRNSPTVLNAALHATQFWDGRAPTVEEQAKGPILNPVEMAMPSEEAVVERLRSISGYGPLFSAAFPDDPDPLSYDNVGRAIGAFERKLVTPAPFDAFLAGDDDALTPEQLQGLRTFVTVGCTACHAGPALGGQMFQRIGLVVPYETEDEGRFGVTRVEADRQVFKVPSLRNVAETGPWFHDGSVPTLEQAIQLMARHQLGRDLNTQQVAAISAFLDSLTGELPAEHAAPPTLPE